MYRTPWINFLFQNISCLLRWYLCHASAHTAYCCYCCRTESVPFKRKICRRSVRLPTLVVLGFPCGSAGKDSNCNAGDLGLNPGLGRSLEKGKGYPLQDSGLENSMDYIVHGVAKRLIQLSNFHFHFPVDCFLVSFGGFCSSAWLLNGCWVP